MLILKPGGEFLTIEIEYVINLVIWRIQKSGHSHKLKQNNN